MDINKFFSLIFNHVVPKKSDSPYKIEPATAGADGTVYTSMSGFGLRTVYLAQ